MPKRGIQFSEIRLPKRKYSLFNLSHGHKVNMDMGWLVPVECVECLPGEHFKISTSALARMQTLISPIMERIDVNLIWLKVPYRLLWSGFEDFITGGISGEDAPQMPFMYMRDLLDDSYIDSDHGYIGSLMDYFKLPLPYVLDQSTGSWVEIDRKDFDSAAMSQKISALPFAAFQLCYMNYFVDQNLQLVEDFKLPSGEVSSDMRQKLLTRRRRAWLKDYFTSALLDPQRGEDVTINLSSQFAPVYNPDVQPSGVGDPLVFGFDHSFNTHDNLVPFSTGSASLSHEVGLTSSSGTDFKVNDIRGLSADMSGLSVIKIAALRTAFKLQEFLELKNIGGSRYIEQILTLLGVKSSDARLQRPEVIGYGSMPIMVSEIQTNADSAATTGYNRIVGDLAGKGKGIGSLGSFKTYCEEHCFILGIASIMPRPSYSQGLARMWTRLDALEFGWPQFEHVGEQAIKSRELFFNFRYNDNDQDWGYQSRYSEYKYLPDTIAGDFRTSLSHYHLSRLWSSTEAPQLNGSFVECHPSDRIFATSEDISNGHFLVDFWFDIVASRQLSRFSNPRLG